MLTIIAASLAITAAAQEAIMIGQKKAMVLFEKPRFDFFSEILNFLK